MVGNKIFFFFFLISNLSFGHNSYFMEITSSLLIFMLQYLSNGILGAQFGHHLSFALSSQSSKFLWHYKFQKASHLGFFWIPFLTFSHTCWSVFESQNIILPPLPFSYLSFGYKPKMRVMTYLFTYLPT
jgi:hypothetical protein